MINHLLLVILLVGILQAQENPHGNIDIDCATCHSPKNWKVNLQDVKYDHDKTGFELSGMHRSVYCRDCHKILIFNHIGVACADCHEDIHRGELGSTCETCHNSSGWENRLQLFEEHNLTRFPLIGAHAIIDCDACHVNQQRNEYKTTSVECNNCHNENFKASENPDHIHAQFSTDCTICHSVAATEWDRANYDHPQVFLLKGAHTHTDCNGCHESTYGGTPAECFACHNVVYNTAQEPDHLTFGFPTGCEVCHNETRWDDAVFDHVQASGVELRGAHNAILCTACHINNQTSGLPQDCIGCHRAVFVTATEPNHVNGQFPEDCLVCHSEVSWSPAEFDHNISAFPLTGAHIQLDCESCHIAGQYTNLPTDCWSCHETDYVATTDPNHVTGGYDQDCTICHTTTAWSPATFNHDQTMFPLTGAHMTTDCLQCHGDGYANTPVECVACHQTDYDETTDPTHFTAGFPLTCEDCHNTITWDDANWDHDGQYFPIYSGAHREAWETCADCHMNPADYPQFECIFCHDHNQTDMDEKHREENDYSYLSSACYDCHPQGKSDDD